MRTRLSRALVASALLLGAGSAVSMVWGKPPNSPVNDTCVPQSAPAEHAGPPASMPPPQCVPACPGPIYVPSSMPIRPEAKGIEASPPEWFQTFAEWLNGKIGESFEKASPDLLESLSSLVDLVADKFGDWIPNAGAKSTYFPEHTQGIVPGANADLPLSFVQPISPGIGGPGSGLIGGMLVPGIGAAPCNTPTGAPINAAQYACLPFQICPDQCPQGVCSTCPQCPSTCYPTLEDVGRMVIAGVDETNIIEMIRNQNAHYSLKPDDLIYLTGCGVSSDLITIMQKSVAARGECYLCPLLQSCLPGSCPGACPKNDCVGNVFFQPSGALRQFCADWQQLWLQATQIPVIFERVDGGVAPRYGTEVPASPPTPICCQPLAGISMSVVSALACNGTTCQAQPMDAESYKLHSARRFCEMGQECEQKGDLEMARNCYEEATRVCPGSEYAQLASVKLAMVSAASVASARQATRGGIETQQEPPVATPAMERSREASLMLQRGERAQQMGDYEGAYRCYQQANAICPSSREGQMALQRMMLIRAGRPWLMQRIVSGVENQEAPADRRVPYTNKELEQRDHSQLLFLLAEHYMRAGDMGRARSLYQEAHLVCPDSFYGMRAIERITQIENGSGSSDGRDPVQKPERTQTLLWHGGSW